MCLGIRGRPKFSGTCLRMMWRASRMNWQRPPSLPSRGHLAYGAVLQELHGFERRVEDQGLVLVPDILGHSMAFFADLHEQVHRLVGEARLAVYGDGVALESDYIADDVGYAIQYRLGPFNEVCAMRYPQLVLYRHSLSRGRCGGG